MRSPSLYAQQPGPPRRGALFGVRYTDVRGESVTTLYRVRGAAERFAAKITARGGTAAIYHSEIGEWSP